VLPVVTFPIQDDFDPVACSAFQSSIHAFLAFDAVHGGQVAEAWPGVIASAYPMLGQCALQDQLLQLCLRSLDLRSSPASTLHQMIEYWSGHACITRHHIERGLKAAQFDKEIAKSHDCLSPVGAHHWIEASLASEEGCVTWYGTQCSPFVPLCRKHHQRSPANGYLGNTSLQFVVTGNKQMVVTSLVYFLACLLRNEPILEQPLGSDLPKIRPLKTVLDFTDSQKTITWLIAFGASSPKPLQLWHINCAFKRLRRAKPKGLGHESLVKVGVKGSRKTYSGRPKALKQSQAYPNAFGAEVAAVTATIRVS
jgi:hypothetical protein